jgi:hypothetical protein
MWLVVLVVALVVLVATYLTWIAARVDRLHARAAAAYSALDAHSVRRAAAAATFADHRALPEVQTAAKSVLAATPDERVTAENDLTAQLRAAVATAAPVAEGDDLEAVVATSRRLGLARQVHTDLVRDARGVRRHPLVRVFGFAHKHPVPGFFDIDEPTLDEAGSRLP